jgi:hypothetical protein
MFLILLLFLSTIFHHQWFFDFSPLTHGDWWFYFTETQKEFFDLPQLWTTGGLGGVNLGSSMYPILAIWGSLSQVLSFQLLERLIYFWPSLFLAISGSYFLSRKIFGSGIAVFVGSAVYTYNSYFMLGRTGHLTLMAAFAIAPLVVLFFIKSLNERGSLNVILTSLFASIMVFYEIRAFYILIFVLFFYYLYQISLIGKWSSNKIISLSFKAISPITVVVLINIYWILGFAKTQVLSSNVLFNRIFFGNELLSLPYSIALFHPFWTGGEPTKFIIQQIPYYIWLIPIFAFSGFYLNRKNKNIVFFGFIALLGILLSKQVAHPFSGLYQFLHTYLPGFNAFREASKFYFLIALGYSVLIAGFVDWIWKNWKKGKLQVYVKYFLTVLIVFIFLWNTKPLITGEINTLFVARTIHHDYLSVKDMLLKQNIYSRTLWVPTYSRFSFYSNEHPELSMVNMITGNWHDFIKTKSSDSSIEGELMNELMNQPIADNLLDLSSIKYVIVPLRDTANDDNFFVHYGGHPPEFYKNALDELEYLERIDIGTEEIAVYENEGYRPHVYTTDNKETVTDNVPYSQVRHEMVNPTEYRVRLENARDPLYLNFSESFHPQWKLRIGEFNWFDALIDKNYFISDKNHFKNDAQLNSFRINPEEVCKVDKVHKVCKVNSDGSYYIEATIFFAPQSYMYFGGIISGSTLVGVVSYLFFVLGRRLYDKKKK